jgi:hypothetical protein
METLQKCRFEKCERTFKSNQGKRYHECHGHEFQLNIKTANCGVHGHINPKSAR